MTDEIREQLSALVDDELSDAERPFLLGRLQRDAQLRACLGRYHLIGEVMRGGDVEAASLGVADRVQQALAADAPLHAATSAPPVLWWKPVAGLAVAASVALVAVLSVNSLRTENGTEAVPTLAANPPPVLPAPGKPVARVADAAGEQWDRLDPHIDKRLSGYLVNHNEYAASRGVQGVMPYARIVGFDTSQ